MPYLSQFYGIIITMNSERDAKHKRPHFHARYGDYKLSVAIDGEILAGEFPNKQQKMVLAWAAIHEDELNAAWQLLVSGVSPDFKIEPLK